MTYQQELSTAIDRALAHKLISAVPTLKQDGLLADEGLRKELGATCQSFVPTNPVGLCLLVAQQCVTYISERLDCKAWVALGYMSDLATGGTFWKMDPEELCQMIASGQIGTKEFHAWVLLETGEIIDPIVFPTLAVVNKKYSRGAGRTNFVMNTGRTYKVIPGLPLQQYHPQVIVSVS